MQKKTILKDGTQVAIRTFRSDDIDKLMRFYRSLSLEDRKYLKFDVTKKRIALQRIRKLEAGEMARIIALHKGRIIADGVLEFSADQWSRHQAEILLIIAPSFRQKGLGTLMIRELFCRALQKKVEVIVARMMGPQVGSQKIFHKLGFREQGLLPEHVKDSEGAAQDLIIMACDVRDLLKELELLYQYEDWRRCR